MMLLGFAVTRTYPLHAYYTTDFSPSSFIHVLVTGPSGAVAGDDEEPR